MTEEPNKSSVVKDQCERTAREYYEFRKKGGTANELIEIPAMKKLMGNIKGKRIIDCGCGFGSYAIYCAKQGAIVTAVDISEAMIQLAKQEAKKEKVQIDFRIEDFTNLKTISPKSFDMAILNIAICFNMLQTFKEIARILKPNGVLCFSEAHPIINMKFKDYFYRGIRTSKNVFGKVNPTDPDYEWKWQQYTLEDYFKGLKEAGFMIETLLEPKPAPATKSLNPELYECACREPIFILIRAIKVEGE